MYAPTIGSLPDVAKALRRLFHRGRSVLTDVEWKADTVDPALGNGTLVANAVRSDTYYRLMLELTIGSTTTLGTGAWYFIPPKPAPWDAPPAIAGTARYLDVSDPLDYIGRCEFVTASQLYLFVHEGPGPIDSGVPFGWAAGDKLLLQIDYPLMG